MSLEKETYFSLPLVAQSFTTYLESEAQHSKVPPMMFLACLIQLVNDHIDVINENESMQESMENGKKSNGMPITYCRTREDALKVGLIIKQILQEA